MEFSPQGFGQDGIDIFIHAVVLYRRKEVLILKLRQEPSLGSTITDLDSNVASLIGSLTYRYSFDDNGRSYFSKENWYENVAGCALNSSLDLEDDRDG